MVLFDAVYINNGGGKVLLDLLLNELSKQKNDICFLLDDRIKQEYLNSELNIIFIEASLLNRHQFYKKNKNKYSKIFCFGNLAPTIQLKVPVYTYLHQKYYINTPNSLSLRQKLVFNLKKIIFSHYLKNTNFIFVQSQLMKSEFLLKYKFNNVEVLPFFKEYEAKNESKKENNFLYVSLASSHKNHQNLIEAFCLGFKNYPNAVLNLTVSSENEFIENLISEKVNKGFSIVNHGFIDEKSKLILYKNAEFVIFPSLTESFGLGLIEAVQFKCKIISSNLDYVYEVVKPSLTYNPIDVKDMASKIEYATKNELKNSELIIQNKLSAIIELILK